MPMRTSNALWSFTLYRVSQSILKPQQQFYKEVKKDDGSLHLYDLEPPEAIYEPIPGENINYAAEKKKKPLAFHHWNLSAKGAAPSFA